MKIEWFHINFLDKIVFVIFYHLILFCTFTNWTFNKFSSVFQDLKLGWLDLYFTESSFLSIKVEVENLSFSSPQDIICLSLLF